MTREGRRGRSLVWALAAGLGAMPGIAAADIMDRTDSTVLQRGRVTMTLGGDPVSLTGPRTSLTVANGVMDGTLDGQRFDVRLTGNRAQGTGPEGEVDVELSQVADGRLKVSGTWNGQPVDLTFNERGLEGKARQRASAGTIEVDSCHYDIGAGPRAVSTGTARCLGEPDARRVELRPVSGVSFARPENALLLMAFLTSPDVGAKTSSAEPRDDR